MPSSASPNVKWFGAELKVKVKGEMGRRVEAAAIVLQNGMRQSLSVPNSRRVGRRNVRGRDASKPGEYPRKLLGHLRRGVIREVDRTGPSARVGTNVPYGRWLQTGTRHMDPRPWITLGLRDYGPAMQAALAAGRVI